MCADLNGYWFGFRYKIIIVGMIDADCGLMFWIFRRQLDSKVDFNH